MGEDTTTNVGLETHTMWSETLLEDLYEQIRGEGSDNAVRATLMELQQRGLPGPYLVRCVRAKIGEVQGNRVERLLSGKSDGGKSGGGRNKPRPTSSKAGLFGSLKGLFGKD